MNEDPSDRGRFRGAVLTVASLILLSWRASAGVHEPGDANGLLEEDTGIFRFTVCNNEM